MKDELAQLEQEVLDEKLAGASHVPVHTPAGPSRVAGMLTLCTRDRYAPLTHALFFPTERRQAAAEDDEEAQLRELQASLALN